MYLVGLQKISSFLHASEHQLHMAFSLYLAGMALSMLLAGRVSDQTGRRPVAIVGTLLFIIASLVCAQAQNSTWFMAGRFIQGGGAGCCYVVAYAIIRDVLDDRHREKVLSLLNGIICIMPVLAPVIGYLLMRSFTWQSLFYLMGGMGLLVSLLSVFVLRETCTKKNDQHSLLRPPTESLIAPFFLGRVAVTTLSASVILTFVNASPVLLIEMMHFERGEYAMIMAITSVISMAVSFSIPLALNVLKPLTLMVASQVLFLVAGTVLMFSTSNMMTLAGLTLICVGFPLGFGVAMSQALGTFSLRAGVASSVLGIAQVCGSSVWISFSAIMGISSMNMLVSILLGCGAASLILLFILPYHRQSPDNEQILYQSES